VLPVDLPVTTNAVPTLFAIAGLKKDSGDLILKVVNRSDRPESLDLQLSGLSGTISGGTCTELSAASLDAENSFEQPQNIFPKTTRLVAGDLSAPHIFPAYSATVLRWSTHSILR
jgi:alpha-L-arabinofuranosidase